MKGIIESCGVKIGYNIDDRLRSCLDIEFLEKYIPGMKINNQYNLQDYLIQVRHNHNRNFKHGKQESLIETENLIKDDFMAVVSRTLESLLFMKGFFSIHSAALQDNEGTILFSGRPRVGKTTSVFGILEMNPHLSYFSGDRTVIRDGEAIAGTKRVSFRVGSFIYELKDLNYPREFTEEERKHPWNYNVPVIPESLGLKRSEEKKRVKCIIFPNKIEVPLSVKELSPEATFTRVTNQSFFFLEEFPRMLIELRQIIPTICLYEDMNRILPKIETLVNTVPTYEVSGNLKDISEWVNKEIIT